MAKGKGKNLRMLVAGCMTAAAPLGPGCATFPVQYVEVETMKVYDGGLPGEVRQFAEKTSHETLTIIAENFYPSEKYNDSEIEGIFNSYAQSTRDMRLWNDMRSRGADFFVRLEERYEEKTEISQEGTKKERTIFVTGDFYKLKRQK